MFQISKDFDVVFWMLHIDNQKEKVRNIKEINPNCILVMSKRNDDQYSFIQILNRCIEQRSNLMIEFRKKDNIFEFRLFDPLGIQWYYESNVSDFALDFYNRLKFIYTTHREGTLQGSIEKEHIEYPKNFLSYANKWSDIFYQVIKPDDKVSRFLGNVSFRYQNDHIVVSERDADKTNLGEDNFVVCYKKDGHLFYIGDKKPSRDAII